MRLVKLLLGRGDILRQVYKPITTDISPNETNTQNHSMKESEVEKKNEQLEEKNSVPESSGLEAENGVKFRQKYHPPANFKFPPKMIDGRRQQTKMQA